MHLAGGAAALDSFLYRLALASLGRLLIESTTSRLDQYLILLDSFLEAPEKPLERFVRPSNNECHASNAPFLSCYLRPNVVLSWLDLKAKLSQRDPRSVFADTLVTLQMGRVPRKHGDRRNLSGKTPLAAVRFLASIALAI